MKRNIFKYGPPSPVLTLQKSSRNSTFVSTNTNIDDLLNALTVSLATSTTSTTNNSYPVDIQVNTISLSETNTNIRSSISVLSNITFNNPIYISDKIIFDTTNILQTIDNDLYYNGEKIMFDLYPQPPVVVYGIPRATPTEIYIPIIYPTQRYSAYFPQPIPTIARSKFNITYYDKSNTLINDALVQENVPFDRNFVNGLSPDVADNYPPTNNTPLTGIIITNSRESRKIPQLELFPDGKRYWAIVYRVPNNLTEDINKGKLNFIRGIYSNYLGNSIPSDLYFGVFLSSSAPSTDAAYIFTTIAIHSAIFNIQAPSKADFRATNSTVQMSKYVVSFITVGSDISFNPVGQNEANININYTGQLTSGQFLNLFPDSNYVCTLVSFNTLGFSSSSPDGNFRTLSLAHNNVNTIANYNTQDAFYSNIFTSGTIYSYTNTAHTAILNLVNNRDVVSKEITVSINRATSTRGVLGAPIASNPKPTLMSLDCSVIELGSNILNMSSFPLITGTTNKTNNITITFNNTSDQYTAHDTGFYSKVNNIVLTIDKTALTPRSQQYLFTIDQTYFATPNEIFQISLPFFYDQVIGAPTVNSGTIAFNTPTIHFVSGVKVIGTDIPVLISGNISNMGKFFYRSPLITYTFSGGSTSVISEPFYEPLNATHIDGTISYTNRSITAIISPTFSKFLQLILRGTNITGSTDDETLTLLNAIFDKPSVDLVGTNGTIPSTIQTITPSNPTQPIVGCRIWSPPPLFNVNKTTYNNNTVYSYFPQAFNFNGISYNTFLYDHTWNINSTVQNNGQNLDLTNELQVFNGAFQSNGSTTNGYLNYSSITDQVIGNTVNYSSLGTATGDVDRIKYKYATFVWKYPNGSTLQYNNFNFTLHNFKVNGNPIQTLFYTNTNDNLNNAVSDAAGSIHINNDINRIFVHYRIESLDPTKVTPTSSSDNCSTVWVDGNSSIGTSTINEKAEFNTDVLSINNANYYSFVDINNIPIIRTIGGKIYSFNQNELLITLPSIIFCAPSIGFYVYFRIGLPMNNNYSFSHISLVIS